MFRRVTAKEMIKNEELRSKNIESGLNGESQNLGIKLSEREINEIVLGMQLSDIEIQLLELQLGGI